MERLEAAIRKARGQQAATQGATGRMPARPAAQDTVSEPVAAAWAALTPLALDRKTLKRNRIMAQEASAEATAFDVLRTRALRMMQEKGWRRLAITSPTSGCGKSTVALNMALSLARQKKIRTISIEVDMRQPSQAARLDPHARGALRGRGHGESAVAEMLTGRTDFAELAQRVEGNLALVTNAFAMRNASDILLDAHVGTVLDEIEAVYQPDVILFDTPPALQGDDTLAFMQHVDAALIVAAAEASTIAEIDRCEREVAAQTNVMGVVLNKCRLVGGGYGYDDYGYRD